MKNVTGLVSGDTGAAENETEPRRPFERSFDARRHPRVLCRCGVPMRGSASEPDKRADADSSLHHSQMGLGLKFK